jgi:hypothetical protein
MSTVGLDEENVRKNGLRQEQQEKHKEVVQGKVFE